MELISTAEVQEDGRIFLPQNVVQNLGLAFTDEVGFYRQADKVWIEKISEVVQNTPEYYQAKGFDILVAEYLASSRKRLTAVKALALFRLLLTYEDDEKRILDCSPLIAKGGRYQALRDMTVFENVFWDNVHTVWWETDPLQGSTEVWGDRIELTADECYILSVPAIVDNLTREEMLRAKEYAIRIGIQIVGETELAGFCVGLRRLGVKL